jgi:hypothetical protein
VVLNEGSDLIFDLNCWRPVALRLLSGKTNVRPDYRRGRPAGVGGSAAQSGSASLYKRRQFGAQVRTTVQRSQQRGVAQSGCSRLPRGFPLATFAIGTEVRLGMLDDMRWKGKICAGRTNRDRDLTMIRFASLANGISSVCRFQEVVNECI